MGLEIINKYIENLYKDKEELNRKKFQDETELKDFIPVVDDDVARFLKLIITISNFIKSGVADIIDIKFGDAKKIIPSLNKEYDLIFQDVDKRLYPVLFDNCIKLLKPGGILVAEDTLFPVIDLDP